MPLPQAIGSTEEVFNFFGELSGGGVISCIVERGELFQQAALFFGEMGGCDHFDGHVKVAPAVAIDLRNPLSPNPETVPALSPLGDAQRFVPVQRRNLDLCAETCLREVDRNRAKQVVPLAPEERMLLDMKENVKIARRPAVRSGFAFAGDAEAAFGIDAGGDIDSQGLLHADVAFSVAFLARVR